jgi:hypothetical protein
MIDILVKYRLLLIQVSLFTLGAVLLIMGILHSELTEILRKATIICMECIGIG